MGSSHSIALFCFRFLAAFMLLHGTATAANERVKIGFMSTLSGPGSGMGVDIRDGFQLALKHNDNKAAGLPIVLLIDDDAQSPDTAKQITERFLKRDRVDFMSGIIFSNIMLAVGPAIFENQTYYISANSGPSQFAGAQCNPFFFNTTWQGDALHEAMGQYLSDKKIANVYLVAPNYPGGKDALSGFKRFYKGKLANEHYVKLGQLDFAAELAQIRAAKPDAVYFFLPGGMGVNFIKQYGASGLNKSIPLFTSGFSADEDTIKAVGNLMIGMTNSTHWAADLDNPQNVRFVADFQREFGRFPSLYAAQGYDAAQAIVAAVRDVNGKLEDKAALGRALRAAHFKSVRGAFRYNTNQYPIQNYYLRVVEKNAQGQIRNRLAGTILSNHADAYVAACSMK